MKILTIISLVLALLAERTTSHDEARINKSMGNIMKNIDGKLKIIRQYFKQHYYGDIRILENMADNLESSLANDMLSLRLSQGGIAGVAAQFNRPFFIFYGNQLIGYVRNGAPRSPSGEIDERELRAVLDLVHDLQVNIQLYEDTPELFNMFEEAADLLAAGRHATFSGVEPEIILKKLLHIDNIVSSIFESKKVNLLEFVDLCNSIYEYLEFFTGLGWNLETRERELKGSKYEVQGVTRYTRRPAGLGGKSAFRAFLESIGSKWSSALGGFTSVLNIYNEAANIVSTEEHIRNKKQMIRELRKNR